MGMGRMTKVRAYRVPLFTIGVAVGLLAALLIWYLAPQGDPQAAGKRTVRNFDKSVQLTASSGITLSFKAKGGSCSAQRCGQFTGKVTSPDPNCISGRTVQIKNSGGTVVATATTDASGDYSTGQLTGLSGSYTATVTASSGYGYTCDAATSGSVTV